MSKITPPTSAPQAPVPTPIFDYLGTGSYSPRPDTIASMATKTVKYVGLSALFLGACYLLYSFFFGTTPKRPQSKSIKTSEPVYDEDKINRVVLQETNYKNQANLGDSTVVIDPTDTNYAICQPKNAKRNTEILRTYFILALAVSECNTKNVVSFLPHLCDNLDAGKNFKELITTHKSEEAIKALFSFVQKSLEEGVSAYPHMPQMAKDPEIFAKAAHEVLTDTVTIIGKKAPEDLPINEYQTLFTLLSKQASTKDMVLQTITSLLNHLHSSVSFKMKIQSAKKCEAFEELVNAFVERYRDKLKEAKITDQKLDASLYTKANNEYPIVTLFNEKFGEKAPL